MMGLDSSPVKPKSETRDQLACSASWESKTKDDILEPVSCPLSGRNANNIAFRDKNSWKEAQI